MKTNLFISAMRTVVPIVAGVVLAAAAKLGLDLDYASVTGYVTAGFIAGYYALFRLLEEAADRIGVPWLRTLAGIALGYARPPQYVGPVTAPVRLKLDIKATEAEFGEVLRRIRDEAGGPRGRP